VRPVWPVHVHTLDCAAGAWFIRTHRQCHAIRFGFWGLTSLAMARMISDNSYLWAWKPERNETLHTRTTWQVIAACAISKSPTTAKLLSVTSARSKSTVNSSQCRQIQWSTRHTILGCGELTGSPTNPANAPCAESSFCKFGKKFFWVSTMCAQILGFSRVRVRISIRVSLV